MAAKKKKAATRGKSRGTASNRKSKKREPPAKKMIIRRNAAPARARPAPVAEEPERTALSERIESMDGSHVAAGLGIGALANVLGVITVGRGWIGPKTTAGLPGHVAYVEIHSRNVGGDTQQFSTDRAYALADRMARTNEHCLSLVANLTDRLMTTHVQLQTGSARLLEAATGAIKVTTGIERIERDKQLDVGEMCDRIVEAIELLGERSRCSTPHLCR